MDRAVHALVGATDLVLRALVIQALWLLGTLVGGVVLGWAPATMAAVDAAACAERGEPIRWGRAARIWRKTFLRSQVTLGLPGLFVLAAAWAALSSAVPLAAAFSLGAVLVVLTAAIAHIPDLELRYDLRATRVFGRAVVLALAQAPSSLVLLAVLVLWAAIVAALPGLAPFLGVAVPLLAGHHLVSRSLDRNEDLLAAQALRPTGVPRAANPPPEAPPSRRARSASPPALAPPSRLGPPLAAARRTHPARTS